jgi:hypothetical protein
MGNECLGQIPLQQGAVGGNITYFPHISG